MHASTFVAALALGLTTGVALKPPTYVPPTDKEKDNPEVRERLDEERSLIKSDRERVIEIDWEKARRQAEVDVAQVLDEFHLYAAEARFDDYFHLMHEEGVFLGTDASERWTKTEFMDYARPIMVGQGRGWEYRPRDRHISVRSGLGGVAWFDELLDHDRYGVLRGSGVLVRDEGGWKIMQYNLAFTIPNDDAPAVVELIRGGGAEESDE